MRKTILTAAALMLFSSAAMAQSTGTKSHDRSCSPERQHAHRRYDQDKMSKKKMTRSEKMRKSHARM